MNITTQTGQGAGVNPRALNDEAQRRYMQGIASKDYESVAALYAENPIYLPVTGGILEDRESIRLHYAQSGMTALDVRSVRLEMISDTVLFDTGTFTAILSEEVGGGTFEGEYVAVSEVKENGLEIRSLTAFPKRQPPAAPDQE